MREPSALSCALRAAEPAQDHQFGPGASFLTHRICGFDQHETFNSASSGDTAVDDSLLAKAAGDDGNELRYDDTDATSIYNLSIKGTSATGDYTINITSDNSNEYTLNPATCSIIFGIQ